MSRSRDDGFTLIEVLIAIAILSLMMLVAWGTLTSTMDSKRQFEKVQDRYREVRAALLRLERDFSMAYLSGNENTTLMDRRTYFVGEPSTIDSARFTSLVHTPLFANANEADQTVVAYSPEPDPEDRSQTNLVRREARIVANEKLDALPADIDVLLYGVTKLKLAYWNFKDEEWEDSWDSTKVDGQLNRLPDRVKVTIGFLDERRKEVTLTTQLKLHLQEQLQFYAN